MDIFWIICMVIFILLLLGLLVLFVTLLIAFFQDIAVCLKDNSKSRKKAKVVSKSVNERKLNNVKENSSLSINALKFEYESLYKIIEEELIKLRATSYGYEVNESYLLNMHEYFKNTKVVFSGQIFCIELLASFYKAVIVNPILVHNKSLGEFDKVNIKLVANVVKSTNYNVATTKHQEIISCMDKYFETGDDVYLFACNIIDRYL